MWAARCPTERSPGDLVGARRAAAPLRRGRERLPHRRPRLADPVRLDRRRRGRPAARVRVGRRARRGGVGEGRRRPPAGLGPRHDRPAAGVPALDASRARRSGAPMGSGIGAVAWGNGFRARNGDPADGALQTALDRGWVVSATDYQPNDTYIIGRIAAANVIDAARATSQLMDREFGAATTPRRYDVVTWGHSQGGHAALWAGQLMDDLPAGRAQPVSAADAGRRRGRGAGREPDRPAGAPGRGRVRRRRGRLGDAQVDPADRAAHPRARAADRTGAVLLHLRFVDPVLGAGHAARGRSHPGVSRRRRRPGPGRRRDRPRAARRSPSWARCASTRRTRRGSRSWCRRTATPRAPDADPRAVEPARRLPRRASSSTAASTARARPPRGRHGGVVRLDPLEHPGPARRPPVPRRPLSATAGPRPVLIAQGMDDEIIHCQPADGEDPRAVPAPANCMATALYDALRDDAYCPSGTEARPPPARALRRPTAPAAPPATCRSPARSPPWARDATTATCRFTGSPLDRFMTGAFEGRLESGCTAAVLNRD